MQNKTAVLSLTLASIAVGLVTFSRTQGPPGPPSGIPNWTTQLTVDGNLVIVKPVGGPGEPHLQTDTYPWLSPAQNALGFTSSGTAKNMLSGGPYQTSASESGTIQVHKTWSGQGNPPNTIYLALTSSAWMHFGNGAVRANDVDNGLHHDKDIAQDNDSVSGESSGTRYVKLDANSGTIDFTVTLHANASGTGYKFSNSAASVSFNIAPAERAVSLTSSPDPTYYRDANGIPVENKPDASGCMFGDTIAGPIQGNGNQQEPYYGPFDFNIERHLHGIAWHTEPSDLFNEWIREYPYDEISDGLLSENTWIPCDYQYNDTGPTLYRTIQSLKGGPDENDIWYKATDQVDNFSAETKYFMRMHLPCELTGNTWQSEYFGDLWNCPENAVAFHPLFLYGYYNNTGQTVSVTFNVSYSQTYTYSSGNALNGGIGIDVSAIKVQLGGDSSHSTTESSQFTLGSSITISVPAQSHRYVYAHTIGTATFPIGSKYGLSGFVGDGNLFKINYAGFELGIHETLLP